MNESLIQAIRERARIAFASGETSAEIYRRAREQEASGFTASSPFTRLLASTVGRLEKGESI